MAITSTTQSCCSPGMAPTTGFKVEAVVSVDERGQMILPKELREKASIRAGEKLAVVTWHKNGEVCCLSLIKTEALAEMVKGLLGPMASELTAK